MLGNLSKDLKITATQNNNRTKNVLDLFRGHDTLLVYPNTGGHYDRSWRYDTVCTLERG